MADKHSAEIILLKCVEAISGLKLESISLIVEQHHFNKLITKLRDDIRAPTSFKEATPLLQSSINEYFSCSDLIDFSKAASGDIIELGKLTLLLLYISLVGDQDIRGLLSNNLDYHVQHKFKYLIESIQKRSSGLSVKYLDILLQENLDNRSGSSKGSTSGGFITKGLVHVSPIVYTSSPKSASQQSPLKELLQSPTFRMQRKMDMRIRDVKRLNRDLTELENEKQEWIIDKQMAAKKIAKLGTELTKVREHNNTLRQDMDGLETRVVAGEGEINAQAHKLGKYLTATRTENAALQHELKEVMDTNEELATKDQLMTTRFSKVSKDLQRTGEQLLVLTEQHDRATNALDEKDQYMKDQEKRVLELEQCIAEYRLRVKPLNQTIESLDASHSATFTIDASHRPAIPASQSMENLGDAVVDLLLQESRMQLQELQLQHKSVTEQLQQTKTAADKQLCEAEKQCKRLQAELAAVQQLKGELSDQVVDATTQIQQRCASIEALEAKSKQAESQAQQQRDQVQSLQQQVQSSCQQVQQLSQQMEDKSTQLLESCHHAQGLASQLDEVVKQKATVEREYGEMVQAHKLTTDQLQQATLERATENEIQLTELKCQLSKAAEQRACQDSKCQEQQRHLAEGSRQLQDTTGKLQRSVATVQEQAGRLTKLHQEKKQLATEAERNVQQLKNSFAIKFTEKENLLGQLKRSSDSKLKEHSDLIVEKEKKVRFVYDKLEGLKAESQNLMSEALTKLTDATNERDGLKTKMAEMKTALGSQVKQLKVDCDKDKLAIKDRDVQLEALKSKYENEVKTLSDFRSAKVIEVKELQDNVKDLSNDLKKKNLRVGQSEDQLKNLQKSFEQEKLSIIKNYDDKESDTKLTEERFKEKVLLLESTRSNHEAKLQEVESCIKSMSEENQCNVTKLHESVANVQELEAKLKDINTQLEKQSSDQQQRESAQQSSHEAALASLKRELTVSATAHRTELQHLKLEADKQVDGLTETLQARTEQLAQKQNESQNTDQKLKTKIGQVDNLNGELSKKNDIIKKMTVELKEKVTILSEENKKLRFNQQNSNNVWERKSTEARNQCQQLEKSIAGKVEALEKSQTELTVFQVLITGKESLIKKMSKNADHVTTKHEEAIKEINKTLTQKDGSLHKLKKELLQKNESLSEKEAEAKSNAEVMEEMKRKLSELVEQTDRLTKDKTEVEVLLQSVKDEVATKEKMMLSQSEKSEKDFEELKKNNAMKLEQLTSETRELSQQHNKNMEDAENRSSESENNYKSMISSMEKKAHDELSAKETELNKQILTVTDAVKHKEGLIISLMARIQDGEEKLSKKEKVSNEMLKALEVKSEQNITDITIKFKNEKDQLNVKVEEARTKLSQLESDLSCKTETLVQNVSFFNKSEVKCNELEEQITQLKSKHISTVADYTKQGQELELAQTDLAAVKDGCVKLQARIELDKQENSRSLEATQQEYATKRKDLSASYDRKSKAIEAGHSKIVRDKDGLFNSLKRKYEDIFEQKQNIEEEHTVQVAQLQSDLATLQQHKLDQAKELNESSHKLTMKIQVSKGEVKLLENRLKDITLANEMLKIDLSNEKKEYLVKISELNKEMESIDSARKELDEQLGESVSGHMETMSKFEVSQDKVCRADKELHDVIAKNNKKIQTLKDDHNEQACFLEDKVSNLVASLEQLKKDMASKLEKCDDEHKLKIQDNFTKNDTEIVKLNKEITERRVELTEKLLKCKSEYEEKIESLTLNNSADVAELNKLISSKEVELQSLSENKDDLELKLKEIETKHNTDSEKLKEIISTKEAETAKSEELLKEVTAANAAKVSSLEELNQSLRKSVSSMETDVGDMKQALTESSTTKALHTVQLVELEEQVKVYKQRLVDRENEAMESCKERDELKSRTEELSEKNLKIEDDVKKLETVSEELKSANRILNKEKDAQIKKAGLSEAALVQQQQKVRKVEASLIDRESQCAAAEEEVMRVERVAENDVESLKQEMAGLKQKYKADKQAYADKLKSAFKDQFEKLMTETETYRKMSEDYSLLQLKYEAAKRKMAQAYAELNDVTTAKDDYYQQMNKYKELVSKLRESIHYEKQLCAEAEQSCQPMKTQLHEATQALRILQGEKRSLETQLTTADSKIRQINKNWSRESLGVANGPTIRDTVSQSSQPVTSSRATRATARPSDMDRQSLSSRSVSDNNVSTRPRSATTTTAAAVVTLVRKRDQSTSGVGRGSRVSAPVGRPGVTGHTTSYRKAVGRSSTSSTMHKPVSSSTDDDLLDDSDVPLLPRATRSSAVPSAPSSSDGLFRKPSIRITATDDRAKPRMAVELRALTSNVEGDEECVDQWEEGEKRLLAEKERRTVEGQRKKMLAQQKDSQSNRRMTVDGRVVKEELLAAVTPTPTRTISRSALARSVPQGLGSFFSCEDEDEEFFSNKYLQDMKVGRCNVSSVDLRMSELQRRNSIYPPHMRSCYAVEMQFNPDQELLDTTKKDVDVEELESATERLVIKSPAFNLRKRKSLSDSLASADSLEVSIGKKVRRLSTSYSRPGPPTPGRKSIGRIDKENKRKSLTGSSGGSPCSQDNVNLAASSSKGVATPGSVSGTGHSLKRLIKGRSPWKSPWKKNEASENTGRRGGAERLSKRINRAFQQVAGQAKGAAE